MKLTKAQKIRFIVIVPNLKQEIIQINCEFTR